MAPVLIELARELARFADTLGASADEVPAVAVVGGLAVSVWTEPRFTRDVDLAVAVAGDREAEALVFQLRGAGYRDVMVREHSLGRLSTVRLVPPGGTEDGVLVDLLFASSGIEVEVAAAQGCPGPRRAGGGGESGRGRTLPRGDRADHRSRVSPRSRFGRRAGAAPPGTRARLTEGGRRRRPFR